jgi:hypothetical protein
LFGTPPPPDGGGGGSSKSGGGGGAPPATGSFGGGGGGLPGGGGGCPGPPKSVAPWGACSVGAPQRGQRVGSEAPRSKPHFLHSCIGRGAGTDDSTTDPVRWKPRPCSLSQ